MALFKIYRGLEANLPTEMHDGYAYFCSDSAAFFIDFLDYDGNLQRKQLNAKDAETLSGASLATILQSSEVEIPTSKAVFDALESKQNKLTFDETPTADSTNPVTSGGVYAARSDWNQNDETAPDYVKNRPFYISKPEEVIFEWDGNTEGLDSIVLVEHSSGSQSLSLTFYKVFNDTTWFKEEELSVDATQQLEEQNTTTIDDASYTIYEDCISITNASSNSDISIFIVTADSITFNDITLSRGTWATIYANTYAGIQAKAYLSKVRIKPVYQKIPDYYLSGNLITAGTGTNAETFNGVVTENASGDYSHAEGYQTIASGDYSHAEGCENSASGSGSHVEGRLNSAVGYDSHAEGLDTSAVGDYTHSENYSTVAYGYASHAEGYDTISYGDAGSHSEGTGKTVIKKLTGDANATQYAVDTTSDLFVGAIVRYGNYPFKIITIDTTNKTITLDRTISADSALTNVSCNVYIGGLALGKHSHVEGQSNIANSISQHVQGEFNIADTEGDASTRGTYSHIVGNGTSNSKRSNAHTLDWSGNAWFAGDVYVGSTSGTNKDEGSVKLMKEVAGTQGQVIGFDADGNAIAQDMPSSIPSVTTSDNGKFLRVVDGAWAAATVHNAEEVSF